MVIRGLAPAGIAPPRNARRVATADNAPGGEHASPGALLVQVSRPVYPGPPAVLSMTTMCPFVRRKHSTVSSFLS